MFDFKYFNCISLISKSFEQDIKILSLLFYDEEKQITKVDLRRVKNGGSEIPRNGTQ